MPYNIKGETPIITEKMERCVADLMKDTKFKPKFRRDRKSSAIAICKSTIMKSMSINNKIIKKLTK